MKVLLLLLLLWFVGTVVFGILLNPMVWQALRNSYWIDKEDKRRKK